ncbi:thermonuclease family protein [Streptomyces cavernae]|uniref:thermonuclease family protein n=1 Tax=Streptomyces cavernae TaxID=2259034 RepID=UPI000FEC03EC|nr:nuclease [Streptomyces cavernae]
MPMLVIQGSFHVKGSQPDGDTVHFAADNRDEWTLVGGRNPVQITTAGRAKLRLEGMDALETHYGGVHQPLPHGHAAAAELLDWLGFTDVRREPDETVTGATPSSRRGFVLTRGADVHGRCVALVGRGNPPGASGTEIPVDVSLLRQTANHHLVAEGLAFPTFYRGLFRDLREELAGAARKAQDDGKGVWADDVTMTGVKLTGLPSITDDSVILPKLFRRLVDYFKVGNMPVSCFPAYLAGKGDPFTVLPTGERHVGLHHVVEVTNSSTVRMTQPAVDLLFDEA